MSASHLSNSNVCISPLWLIFAADLSKPNIWIWPSKCIDWMWPHQMQCLHVAPTNARSECDPDKCSDWIWPRQMHHLDVVWTNRSLPVTWRTDTCSTWKLPASTWRPADLRLVLTCGNICHQVISEILVDILGDFVLCLAKCSQGLIQSTNVRLQVLGTLLSWALQLSPSLLDLVMAACR